MKDKKIGATVLKWLPSIILTLIFIPNAFLKILGSNPIDKVVTNRHVLIGAGLFLVLATVLFLYNKTLLLGTTLLALHMTCIVLIHLYKGKPAEVAILIVIATIFAAYIRKPTLFQPR
ncbi:hypothetical protein MWU65_01060 [Cellulophaga sp. F20128]|uniref:hypothetical protein n=1 Tax=Cellulophaga sp. F20128 TaxID=2926413 RepID=UPI001FF4BB5D|nr:hypothetical protein [Cellulophaga sp. F20128]MCK0155749.1 hypothetical protein [Cellulophaga sp. F20128]